MKKKTPPRTSYSNWYSPYTWLVAWLQSQILFQMLFFATNKTCIKTPPRSYLALIYTVPIHTSGSLYVSMPPWTFCLCMLTSCLLFCTCLFSCTSSMSSCLRRASPCPGGPVASDNRSSWLRYMPRGGLRLCFLFLGWSSNFFDAGPGRLGPSFVSSFWLKEKNMHTLKPILKLTGTLGRLHQTL